MAWSLIHNLYTIEERPLIGLGHRLDTIRHAGASARHSSKRFAPRQTRGRDGPIVSIRGGTTNLRPEPFGGRTRPGGRRRATAHQRGGNGARAAPSPSVTGRLLSVSALAAFVAISAAAILGWSLASAVREALAWTFSLDGGTVPPHEDGPKKPKAES
jgi:hypothetical protein